MKNLLIAVIALSFFACKSAPEGDQAEVSSAQQGSTASDNATVLTVDTDNSIVKWIGSKPTGQHNGIIAVKEGSLAIEGSTITSGSFVIDMTTVKALDMDEENNAKLSGHLMSADFFDVENFPTSTFEFVSAATISPEDTADLIMKDATHIISGNLTLKDSTKLITFPAKVDISGNQLSSKATFNIDRTLWGVHYGNDKGLGDKFIYPTVQIGLDITAKE